MAIRRFPYRTSVYFIGPLKPSVIRIANPGVGIGGRPVVAYGAWSLLHIKGQLEEEFKPDNIQIKWTFARGAGPSAERC
jgi:hypothetical protein